VLECVDPVFSPVGRAGAPAIWVFLALVVIQTSVKRFHALGTLSVLG